MATSLEWLSGAREQLEASMTLAEIGHMRAACSRAYYAAHNAAHSVLQHLDSSTIPSPRSVPHDEIPGRMRRLVRVSLKKDGLAEILHTRLVEAYNIRCLADYHPEYLPTQEQFGAARAAARQTVKLAEDLQ